MAKEYERDIVNVLRERINEPRRFIQVVVGPRQTGKTTAVMQAIHNCPYPTLIARASQDIVTSKSWLENVWFEARQKLATSKENKLVLIIDEVQLVPQWSSVAKRLWDEDTDKCNNVVVILTGSSSLLLQKGLRESLTGRFEVIWCLQWDFSEVKKAFNFTLDDYLFFGGYPGAATLKADVVRWLDYMQNSIIAPSILRDVISLDKVTKPALMESLFYLGSSYSGSEISYRKLMGQLDDAGNATTIAHYLDLLSEAGLISNIKKYTKKIISSRSSSPRLIVNDTALMVASYGVRRQNLIDNPSERGHLIESAVGAYLIRRAVKERFEVNWWRCGDREVDFVISSGNAVAAIEVKSGRIKSLGGLQAFVKEEGSAHQIVVGSADVSLEDFLLGRVPLFI